VAAEGMNVEGLARHSHYVPQKCRSGWSEDDRTVWAYRLLVPRPDYQVWKRHWVTGLLYFTGLYTTASESGESDAFERWINAEIQTPAAEPLEKVRANKQLTPGDWERLALYFAALDVRTPTRYVEHVSFLSTTMEEMLPKVLAGVKSEMEDAARENRPLRSVLRYRTIPSRNCRYG
jgi:hypothetical protein